MAMVEDVADKLATEALELILRTGDENIEKRIAEAIGSSSPTLQEAFQTALRIRKAEERALALMRKLRQQAGSTAAPAQNGQASTPPAPKPASPARASEPMRDAVVELPKVAAPGMAPKRIMSRNASSVLPMQPGVGNGDGKPLALPPAATPKG